MNLHRTFFLLLTTVTLLLSGWVALHLRSGVEWRDQPALTISTAQEKTLATISAPIELTAYVSGNPKLTRAIKNSLIPLQAKLPNLKIQFTNPNTDPISVHQHNITRDGQLYIQIKDKGQRIDSAAPEAILNTIIELAGGTTQTILHLQSSGERAFLSDTGGSWQALYRQLQTPQLAISSVDLTQTINIPQNVSLTIIADPDTRKQAHLEAALKTYLNNGGNLLYTTDTAHPYLPKILIEISGLTLLEGTVVDMAGRELGFEDPRMIPANIHTEAPIVSTLTQLPLFVGTVAFTSTAEPQTGWTRTRLMQSSSKSWNETGDISGHIEMDDNEQRGPLGIGWLLSRQYQGNPQTIILLGDSDLFTSPALPLGGNRMLAQNIITDITQTAGSQSLARAPLKDQYITINNQTAMTWAITQLFLLPLIILLLCLTMRRRIKQRYRTI